MANTDMNSRNVIKKPRRNRKVFQIKEVKLRPNIEDHDFFVKLKNAQRFLGDGNKVKVTIMFRGREMTHPELGQDVLDRFAKELGDTVVREKPPKLEGRNMTMIVAQKHNKGEYKMPKMKTRRAAAKRFTETGSGQFKRNKAFKKPHSSKRSPRRERRNFRKAALVSKSDYKRVARLLPNG